MNLVAGFRIGPYEIVEPLGAGGMGEVYRARDTRLQRDVAIKLLPERSSHDREAVARLQQEARTASALNHPHILTIYDIGLIPDSQPARDYIAMEFIDGKTLRDRIGAEADQPVLLDALIEVGEGLAKAHEADVIHRDLKPENIMITSDGYAKILDFGLAARMTARDDVNAPTDVLTSPGTMIGTIAYMAPEQLRGEPADPRADIWAFGCILYEVLTGRRAFAGQSAAETMQKILAEEPSPTESSPALQRIVSKCLAREQARRYGNMRDLLVDLRRERQRQRGGASAATRRITQLTFDKAVEQFPAISADGTRVVFSRERGKVRNLFAIVIGDGGDEQLTSGDHDDIQPAWSPDGTALLFVRGREPGSRIETSDVFGRHLGGDIWRIDLESRKETLLINDAANPAWSPDGSHIAFDAARNGPHRIWICDARGRNPEQITSDDTDAAHHVRPRWSMDGRLLTFQNLEGTKFDVKVVDLAARRSVAVTDDYTMDLHPVWSSDGEWIYFSSYRSGGINVWRIPVGAGGSPIGAMEQVTAGPGQDVDLSFASSGKHRLVFAILKQNADIWRLPVDPATGEVTGPPEAVIETTRENSRGAWSPDGSAIAFSSDRGGEMNLWLLTLRDSKTRQLTRGGGGDFQPSWSPDGRSIVFFSSRGGSLDVWHLSLENGEARRLTNGEGININPFFSPDGKSIAFMSDRDGRLEVWRMDVAGGSVRQLTTVGVIGHFLRWSSDGSRLFFRCPTGPKPRTMTVPAMGGDPEPTAEVIGGAHMSLSPDQSLMMDVVAHRTLWVSPLTGGAPRRVFEFEDPESRIDYPVWSPDGRWIIFDRFVPHGGDVWMIEEE